MTRSEFELFRSLPYSEISEFKSLEICGYPGFSIDLNGNVKNDKTGEIIEWFRTDSSFDKSFNFIKALKTVWATEPISSLSASYWFEYLAPANSFEYIPADHKVDLRTLNLPFAHQIAFEYYITPEGVLWNGTTKRRVNGRPLSGDEHRIRKYLVVDLRLLNGRERKFRIDMLTAAAYLENPTGEQFSDVIHINDNAQDNRVENLAWPTLENISKYARSIDRRRVSCDMIADLTPFGFPGSTIDINGCVYLRSKNRTNKYSGTVDKDNRQTRIRLTHITKGCIPVRIWDLMYMAWIETDPSTWPNTSPFYEKLVEARQYVDSLKAGRVRFMRDIAKEFPDEYDFYRDGKRTIVAISADGFAWNDHLKEKMGFTPINGSNAIEFMNRFYSKTNPDPKQKRTRKVSFARIVALAFLGKPEGSGYFVVNHINGDQRDDRLENLEWRSRSDFNKEVALRTASKRNKTDE